MAHAMCSRRSLRPGTWDDQRAVGPRGRLASSWSKEMTSVFGICTEECREVQLWPSFFVRREKKCSIQPNLYEFAVWFPIWIAANFPTQTAGLRRMMPSPTDGTSSCPTHGVNSEWIRWSNLNGSDEHRSCLVSWYMLLPQNPLVILSPRTTSYSFPFLSSPHPIWAFSVELPRHIILNSRISWIFHGRLAGYSPRGIPWFLIGPLMLTAAAPARARVLPWAPLARGRALPRCASPRRVSWSWLAATWLPEDPGGDGIAIKAIMDSTWGSPQSGEWMVNIYIYGYYMVNDG